MYLPFNIYLALKLADFLKMFFPLFNCFSDDGVSRIFSPAGNHHIVQTVLLLLQFKINHHICLAKFHFFFHCLIRDILTYEHIFARFQ